MDSGALLDLLGNQNRRRILRLLAQKPCYVTEISEYLDVSPKAVIDHLRKLEESGLVKSRTDEQRRKYFYIADDLRLEVNVSRYGFGTKSAYPASSSFDLTTCRHLSIELDGATSNRQNGDQEGAKLGELVSDLQRLEELENELSLAQRCVQGRVIEAIEGIVASIDADAQELVSGRLLFDVLVAIANGARTTTELQAELDVPSSVIRDALERFEEHGILAQADDEWELVEPG